MSNNALRVRRIFDVPWDDRWAFLQALMGDAAKMNGTVYRMPAAGMPSTGIAVSPDTDFAQGLHWLYPVAVENMEPVGPFHPDANNNPYDADDVAHYSTCRITVAYENVTYRVLPDSDPVVSDFNPDSVPDESTLARYVSIFVQPTAEYLTLPFGAYSWVEWVEPGADAVHTGGLPGKLYVAAPQGSLYDTYTPGSHYPGTFVTGSNGKIVGAAEVMVTWHQVPFVPRAINTSLGTVNSNTITDPEGRVNMPPGTALLTTVEMHPYRWFGGKLMHTINYKWKYFNPAGDGTVTHNHFLHYRQNFFKPPVYRYLTHNGVHPAAPFNADPKKSTGALVYAAADHSQLFKP